MRLNTLAGLGLALLGLACAGCEKKPDNVLTIAYAPNESTEQSVDARNGMAAELGKALGMEVKEIHTSDYTAIIEALRTGQADMAYIGSLAVGMAMKRAKATPVVMKAPEGDRAKAIYHSVIVVRADNAAINSIRDLKGRTMAFVDPDSTSGNLLPTADIIKAFPELHLNSDHLHANGDFFEAVSYSGKHQAGLQAVLKGDIDAATFPQCVAHGILPSCLSGLVSWYLYSLEVNIRASAVVGMVGGGGIGLVLFSYIKSFNYHVAFFIIIILIAALVIVVDWVTGRLRKELAE